MSTLWALQAESCQEIFASLSRELAAHFESRLPVFSQRPLSEQPYALAGGIATIKISGVIDRQLRISYYTGLPYTAGQNVIRTAIASAIADPEVRGVMLSISSPGGVVAGTRELAEYIASSPKPVAAYADGLCASAAFWLAAATGRIYAPLTAQLGSIGVIAVLSNWTKANERIGIGHAVLHSGKWKAAGHPDKPLTEEEAAMFQSQLDAIHAIFRADVKNWLEITAPDDQWAEGQTLLGREAVSLGLASALVRDEAEAVSIFAASIHSEEVMDLQELKAKYPDLVEAITREAASALQAQNQTAAQTAAANAQAETLALVRAVAGPEAAAKVEAAVKTGVTASQLEALAPILGAPSRQESPEAAARQSILQGIAQATGQPLPGSAPNTRANSLVADAERRAGGLKC